MDQSPIPRPSQREQAADIASQLRTATLQFSDALLCFELGHKLKALEIDIAHMSESVKEPLADAFVAVESLCREMGMSPRPASAELHRRQALEALIELQSRLPK